MAKNKPANDTISKIVALCKRRGIIFQSSEIYGGAGATYDYGPAGVELKNNISRSWWNEMTLNHDNIVGLDSAILLHPKVWESSGHVKNFHDPLIECKNCRRRLRLEEFIQETSPKVFEKLSKLASAFDKGTLIKPEMLSEESPERLLLEQMAGYSEFEQLTGIPATKGDYEETFQKYLLENYNQCTKCGEKGSLQPPRQFNLMFKTDMGAVADGESIAYFRPETAQGLYVDYKIIQESSRLKLPFGIAQIGKAFRNEITARNFIFRTREFEQMEMQYFVHPGETAKYFEEWREARWQWHLSLGISEDNLRWYKHEKLAHYAQAAYDIEYNFPFGWSEIEGIHDRGDFDLNAHQEGSGKDLTYFDAETLERFIPHIVETATGLNRTMLAVLCEAYTEDEQAGEQRVVLSLHPKLAPTKAAIFPLVKKDGLAELATDIYQGLRGKFPIFYDAAGSIGKRYRRQDEVGTPYCFTIDHDTLEDGTVTVRDRDTLQQLRISKDTIASFIADKLGQA